MLLPHLLASRIARQMAQGGSTVIITGGTRRLGAAMTRAFAGWGWDIVATYSAASTEGRREATAFAQEISGQFGVHCVPVPSDFGHLDEHGVKAILDACPSPAACLVNNAGIFEWDDLGSIGSELTSRILAVNLVAPMLLTSRFLGAHPTPDKKRIAISMLDQKIYSPYPDHVSYTVAKAGLAMFVDMSARESRGQSLHYGIAPGLTLPAPGQSEVEFREAQKTVPLGFSPTPEEIIGCIRFLVRGSARNGSVITIDGGASLVSRSRDFQFHGQSQSNAD